MENAEDLDIVMPMYNLLEYSKSYSKTSGFLWNYYRDELTSETNDDNNLNKNVINSKSFKYKTIISGNTYNATRRIRNATSQAINNSDYNADKEGIKEVEIAVPLKYLNNFWRALDMPLINSEVSLALTSSENCVITSLEKRRTGDKNNRDNSPTNAAFKTKGTKLYVPVITLSTEDDNKPLEQLKTGFKKTVTWNKYRSEMSNQTRNNNLNYLIDPTFTNFNRLFVLSYENETDRTSFSEYYVPKVEIKDFNVLIDGKPFSEIPVKSKEEAYEAIIEMIKNNDYTNRQFIEL